eukprot:scaffold5907_cov120-Isochrysis_galbana.AAC.7
MRVRTGAGGTRRGGTGWGEVGELVRHVQNVRGNNLGRVWTSLPGHSLGWVVVGVDAAEAHIELRQVIPDHVELEVDVLESKRCGWVNEGRADQLLRPCARWRWVGEVDPACGR